MRIRFYLYQARRWGLGVGLPTAIVIVLTYLFTAHQHATYQASAQLFVQPVSVQSTGGVIQDPLTGQYLAQSYSEMITQPSVINLVKHSVSKTYTGQSIGQLSAIASRDPVTQASTQVVGVNDVNTSPKLAAFVANQVAGDFVAHVNSLQDRIYNHDITAWQQQEKGANGTIKRDLKKIKLYPNTSAGYAVQVTQLRSKLQNLNTEIVFAQEAQASSQTINVSSSATPQTSPVGPHPLQSAALFGFLALLLCSAGVFLYDYYIDDSIKKPEQVEELVGAPILGTISEFEASKFQKELITEAQPRSPISESYRLIRTNIQFLDVDHPPRTLVVSSCGPSEGKSTTSANLARIFAEGGHPVTLIDGDLRRPSIQRIFGGRMDQGLTSSLAGVSQNGNVGSYRPDLPELQVITSGPVPPNPLELIGSQRMRALIGDLRADDRFVIVDSPPILAVADAAVLCTMTDGLILVVDPRRVKRRELRRTRESIQNVGGRIIGLVLNRIATHGAGYYYRNYHYGEEYVKDSQADLFDGARPDVESEVSSEAVS